MRKLGNTIVLLAGNSVTVFTLGGDVIARVTPSHRNSFVRYRSHCGSMELMATSNLLATDLNEKSE